MRALGALLLGLVLAAPLAAQSLTGGALRGEVVTADGIGVPGMTLTLEDYSGLELRQFQTDPHGRFAIPLLEPGRYSLLAERVGFQPLRQRGIDVLAEVQTTVVIRVERRPPPITSVVDVPLADQRFTPNTPRIAERLGDGPGPWWAPVAGIAVDGRTSALVAAPFDSRRGLGLAIGGLPQSQSRLLVDGLPGSWTRHPGLPHEPGPTPLLSRLLTQQAVLAVATSDGEWSGGNGAMLGVVSRPPTARLRAEPFAYWSGGIGRQGADNPGDSSAASYAVGLTASGPLVPGRANVIVGFAVEREQLPGARPWTADSARLNGATVNLTDALEAVAGAQGTALRGAARPVVRDNRGGTGGFRVDWRLSPSWMLTTRATLARYRERAPLLGPDLSNGAGSRLESKDYTIGTSFSYAKGDWGNELRIAFRGSERNWSAGRLPSTLLAAEGIGLGGLPATAGNFRYRGADLSEAFQYTFGRARQHRIKAGFQYSSGFWTQDHLAGEQGVFTFGDLDGFEDLRGAFWVTEAAGTRARFKLVEAGLFTQLGYGLAPGITGILGVRYDRQKFPQGNNQYIKVDQQFGTDFGLPNFVVPTDKKGFTPRLGVTWVPEQGRWSASIFATRTIGELNPAYFAEAMLMDGGVTVRRAVGALGSWGTLPDSTVAPTAGRRFTIFNPDSGYRQPRTTKVDAELTRSLGATGAVRLIGGYHHTDYLLRRTDLNLLGSGTGVTQEGRTVYGTLQQEGGMLAAVPGSNRRVAGYDMVSALGSDGFQDYYQAGAVVEAQVGGGITLSASYLWSRTRDNWLTATTGTAEDELSPFAGQKSGKSEWAYGVSDFDVPHRAVAEATWRSTGGLPLRIGARYRISSGLPFTPGFRPGVDANADGSGRNDPAYLDPAIPGMPALLARNPCLDEQSGRMAARNSCREAANHALDLSFAVGLPVRSLGGRLELLVDVFNLAASEMGLVDRALVLVDPAGTVTTDALGNVTLPLVANPHFGKLQSRRIDPRVVRFGLRLAP